MHKIAIAVVTLALAGCATNRQARVPPAPERVFVGASTLTTVVEECYQVRGYLEGSNLRHEGHAVYRRTRVPLGRDHGPGSVSRTAFAPITYTPLPPSDELAAEMRTQREITSNLRAVQARMSDMERQAQERYAHLVRQSADVLKMRAELEAEHTRRRAGLSMPAAEPSAPAAATNIPATTSPNDTETSK